MRMRETREGEKEREREREFNAADHVSVDRVGRGFVRLDEINERPVNADGRILMRQLSQ